MGEVGPYRRIYIRRREHPLYFILPPREIPADSYSLERNKRWPSFFLNLLFLPFSLLRREEQLAEELPLGLLLHSTRLPATDELPGLFFLREPLPARTLFFFLVPRPRQFRSSFLSFFPSLSCCCSTGPGHGIMQRITEKSKQANDHEIHADHPATRYTRDSLFALRLTSLHVLNVFSFLSTIQPPHLPYPVHEQVRVEFTVDLRFESGALMRRSDEGSLNLCLRLDCGSVALIGHANRSNCIN